MTIKSPESLKETSLPSLWQTIPSDLAIFTLFGGTLPLSLLPISVSCTIQIVYSKPNELGGDTVWPRASRSKGTFWMLLSTPISTLEKKTVGRKQEDHPAQRGSTHHPETSWQEPSWLFSTAPRSSFLHAPGLLFCLFYARRKHRLSKAKPAPLCSAKDPTPLTPPSALSHGEGAKSLTHVCKW